MTNSTGALAKAVKYSDVFVAVFIVMIIVMMIIPLPAFLLDILLVLNITLGLVIVMLAMYAHGPLDFTVFPTLLLIATLFRLSLNVSSTRLILLTGKPGSVIEAFGQFVVGGNPVVGFIIFIILIVIQFIVITRGAERIAEVAARFTLDAMPGKQMAIDADMNAGLITDSEARVRRKNIQREADFYGAMDGASKFVKGDAMAAIIIIVVNIVGGFIIGMWQRQLGILEALQQYTLLTVGEGLVNQIPALLISTATGIVVTRAGSEGNLGAELMSQLLAQPTIFYIGSVLLGILGLIPGLPHAPFLLLSLALGGLGYMLRKAAQTAEKTEVSQAEKQELEEVRKPENVVALLQVDPMELEIGYSLIPLVDVQQGGDLLDRVVMIRRQCALELGLLVPTIRIRDNIQLKPSVYVIKLKGVELAQGELLLDHYLAMSPGDVTEAVDGIPTTEPAFGLPALWVAENVREQAELSGYTVVDPLSVMTTHLTEVIKTHADEIMGRQDVQKLVDSVRQNYPAVVEELIPSLLSVGDLQKVLASLLRERISIRDMVTVMETLADYASVTKDTEVLTEYVRHALTRMISKQYAPNGILPCLTVDPQLEKTITDAVQRTDHGSYVAVDPDIAQTVFNRLAESLQEITALGYQPVVVCSPMARLYFRKLTERVAPNLTVLSYAELEASVEIQALGTVRV